MELGYPAGWKTCMSKMWLCKKGKPRSTNKKTLPINWPWIGGTLHFHTRNWYIQHCSLDRRMSFVRSWCREVLEISQHGWMVAPSRCHPRHRLSGCGIAQAPWVWVLPGSQKLEPSNMWHPHFETKLKSQGGAKSTQNHRCLRICVSILMLGVEF